MMIVRYHCVLSLKQIALRASSLGREDWVVFNQHRSTNVCWHTCKSIVYRSVGVTRVRVVKHIFRLLVTKYEHRFLRSYPSRSGYDATCHVCVYDGLVAVWRQFKGRFIPFSQSAQPPGQLYMFNDRCVQFSTTFGSITGSHRFREYQKITIWCISQFISI